MDKYVEYQSQLLKKVNKLKLLILNSLFFYPKEYLDFSCKNAAGTFIKIKVSISNNAECCPNGQ